MKKFAQMTKDEKINFIINAWNTGERITRKEAFEKMWKAHKQNTHKLMLFKVKNESYKEWYESAKDYLPTTLDQETLYIVSENNKAFGNYCGYSIFATSLGMLIRDSYMEIDRIERCPIEYCIELEEGE